MNRCIARAAQALLVAGLAAAPGAAPAQGTFPSKPVRIIVPYTAGGAADFTARLIAQRLTEAWREQVLVENRGGAGGNLGMEAAQKSAPDGHTLVMINNSQAINESLYAKLPFNLMKDFTPVMMVASSPMVLAVNPKVAAHTLAEYNALVKAQPGRLSYGSCGVGTPMHLAGELHKFLTRSFIVHVPYRGCAPATLDTIGGQLDAVFATTATVLPHVRAGKLRALAITTAKRTQAAPEIPTFREAGGPALKDYEVDNWYGLMAPAGAPREALARLEAEVRRIVALPDSRARMAGVGIDPYLTTGDELMALLRDDIEKFARVVRFAGIKGD
ncbi:MAG: tripartite tricarboxylate transporter substrate binding protein [Burkholderiales bacterium]|nr:tripartite tricarboxylate transporter substrate binding protein [Burkholderiales bacterium]